MRTSQPLLFECIDDSYHRRSLVVKPGAPYVIPLSLKYRFSTVLNSTVTLHPFQRLSVLLPVRTSCGSRTLRQTLYTWDFT